MLSNLFLITLLILITSSAVFAAILLLSRCPQFTILDTQKVLRPVHQQRILQLLDSRVEEVVRSFFSPKKFEESQLLCLYEIREHMLRMSHNAFILLTWANTELWRETKLRPNMQDRETFIELSREMHAAAVEFRLYALLTVLRINFWMIFRIRPWCPLPKPRLCQLREIAGLRFYSAYGRLRETTGALCRAYGDEFYDEMMSII
jgi:hypothetical protein